MRKLIVKYFALNYNCHIFGKNINFVRAANIIFPTFILNGFLLIKYDTVPTTVLEVVALSLLIITLFLGFIYFKLQPVKFNELDDSQKWQYGKAISSGQLTKNISLTPEETSEWMKLNDREKMEFDSKNVTNILPLIVNPISIILFLLTYIFIL